MNPAWLKAGWVKAKDYDPDPQLTQEQKDEGLRSAIRNTKTLEAKVAQRNDPIKIIMKSKKGGRASPR